MYRVYPLDNHNYPVCLNTPEEVEDLLRESENGLYTVESNGDFMGVAVIGGFLWALGEQDAEQFYQELLRIQEEANR